MWKFIGSAMICLAVAVSCPLQVFPEQLERRQCTAAVNEGADLIRRGELREAGRTLEDARHECVDVRGFYATFFELAKAYFDVHNVPAARRAAARVSTLAGSNPQVHFSLGLLLARNGQYKMAAGEFAAVPASERDFATYMDLGMAYSKLLEFQHARNAYESAIELNPSSAEPYLHLGLDAAARGAISQAVNWLGQAHAEAPEREDIAYAYTEALIQAGNYERADNILSRALHYHPGSSELVEAEGDLYLGQNQNGEAKQAYLKCLEMDPDSLRARLSLATAYLGMREPEAARQQLEKVLQVQPDNAEANAQLGRMALDAGRQEKAQRLTEMALKADPDNSIASETFAEINIREGNYSKAYTILQKLIKVSPRTPRFHYLLGRVLVKLGRPAEARREFQLSRTLQNAPGGAQSATSGHSR
jgi:tetratricopeptide (TPR) repeat protein